MKVKSLWKHEEDPVLCWGETVDEKMVKFYFTAHDLPETHTDEEWRKLVTEHGDKYISIIMERPVRWTIAPKLISPVRGFRFYTTQNMAIFTAEKIDNFYAMSTSDKIHLMAGSKLSALMALADTQEWPIYFSRHFLENKVTKHPRVKIWGRQKDWKPTWNASNSRGSRAFNVASGAEQPRRGGWYWEEAEEENLINMYLSENYKFSEIAEYHQRSEGAIESRLRKSGCFKQGPMTDREVLLIEKCGREKGDIEALARELQRAPGHCRWIFENPK